MRIFLTLSLTMLISPAWAAHAYAQFGDIKYPPDFKHFSYVNPVAPKGGNITMVAPSRASSFDKYNPFTLKGTAPPALSSLMLETLLVGKFDEPTTAYGLLAEDVSVAADKLSVTFKLNPLARFHNGDPVLASDVKYSFERLTSKQAAPQFRTYFSEVKGLTVLADRVVRFDFKRANAELPLIVIAELVGVPLEDRHKVFEWSNRLIGFDDPEFGNTAEVGKQAAMEMWLYANELAEQRKKDPRDDLVSALMMGEVDGEKLSEVDFDSFFLLLAVAGNETTRNLISGGMRALIEHPAEWKRLKENPALLNTAVEEMLRWVSPVNHFRRTVTRDTEIRGQKLREGDKVIMWYPSANRDEDFFPNPTSFDVGRSPNNHLAFGIGEHFCLGANLARLEIRAIFEEVIRRMPDIELAGPVRRLRSNFINGIKEMPVRFTPSPAVAA